VSFERHQSDSAFVLAKQAYRTADLRSDACKPDRKSFSKSYLAGLLFFLGWLGRGAFGFAPIW
jgi:hypothetical protein